MLILAADTSFGKASVSLVNNGEVLSLEKLEDYSMQAEILFDLVEKTLTHANKTLDDVDAYSASIGPGSFTGIRIGVSALKAMAFASKKDFIGIKTTEALGQSFLKSSQNEGKFCTCLYSGRKQVYYQKFENITKTNDLLTKEVIKSITYDNIPLGQNLPYIFNNDDDIKNFTELRGDDVNIIKQDYDASDVGLLAYEASKNKSELDLQERSLPVYVRDSDAVKAKRKINLSIDF